MIEPIQHAEPRILAEGILDNDGIVYELLPMQTMTFDGRASSIESIPFPLFDTAIYRRGVLSVMLEWSQGSTVSTSSVTLAAWLTLRCK